MPRISGSRGVGEGVGQAASDGWPLIDQAGVELKQRCACVEHAAGVVRGENAADADDRQTVATMLVEVTHDGQRARMEGSPAQAAWLVAE